jgi:N-acetylglucosaminyl-diphospho-decaprenol L-rhamnosyltransferase
MLDVSVSIVSHCHGELLVQSINSINKALLRSGLKFEIIITFNVSEPEEERFDQKDNFVIIRNIQPKGFGSNHNAAFKVSKGEYFIVCNPDIKLPLDFNLSDLLDECPKFGILSPQVFNESGKIEDFCRSDLSITNILRRKMGLAETRVNDFRWLAGIFLVFKASTFYSIGGFDEDFYMYVEDCDICRRIYSQKGEICISRKEVIIHFAQRKTGKSLKHTLWHINSFIMYWKKHAKIVGKNSCL